VIEAKHRRLPTTLMLVSLSRRELSANIHRDSDESEDDDDGGSTWIEKPSPVNNVATVTITAIPTSMLNEFMSFRLYKLSCKRRAVVQHKL
jgi:hypothetical protein